MKIEEIDNCDDLDDIKVFAILVTDVPSKYVAQAKKIDGKYYKEDCFGIEISYHADEDKYVISSEYDKQLYYVDFNGNWHWLDYTFTQAEKDAAIELCKKDLQKESILQVLCKYKIVQKNLFKWTELNSVRFYVIRKISTCQ